MAPTDARLLPSNPTGRTSTESRESSPNDLGSPAECENNHRQGIPVGAAWPAPRGIVLSDLEWVSDIARRYHLQDLLIPPGSIVLERISATGGRCFCYPDGSWLIGLSQPRVQRSGRRGVEGIVAHELLHAWLWSLHRYRGHGPVFLGHAAVRGIPRWCSAYHEVRRQGPQQLALFDTWPPAPSPSAR